MCCLFGINDLFGVRLFVLFCEPRRGDFYFAVLVCCLFCINDLFDVHLFVFASRGAEIFILRSWCVVFLYK